MQIGEPTLSEERLVEELRAQVEDLLLVGDVSLRRGGKAVLFSGRLLWDAETAFSLLYERLKPKGLLPFLQRRKGQDSVLIVPAPPERGKPKPIINLLLFLATILTTLYVGAAWEGFDALQNPATLKFGIPFASALLLILGTHELSHYFVARRHGLRVSLPYFIPVPFGLLGTFGAFIRMESVAKDRKGFFDVGLAGPLAGLAIAIPILILGLSLSEVKPIIVEPGYFQEGNSLLYLTLKYIVHGQILPSGGVDVWLHPVAFAGWIGLFITGVNLLPGGQLDGGHVAYALLGGAFKWVAQLIILLLMGLGFLWRGWLIWAFFILLTGPAHPRPLNDITGVGGKRKVIGILALILLLTIFTPVPLS